MKKSEIQYFFVFIFVSKEEAYSLSSIFVCTLSAFRNIIHIFFSVVRFVKELEDHVFH